MSALHRGLWIYLPAGFRRLDQYVTNGRFSAWLGRTAHHLWNDRHPVIMVRSHTLSCLSRDRFYYEIRVYFELAVDNASSDAGTHKPHPSAG